MGRGSFPETACRRILKPRRKGLQKRLAKTKGQIFAGRFVPLSLKIQVLLPDLPPFPKASRGHVFQQKSARKRRAEKIRRLPFACVTKKQFFAKQPLFCYDNHGIIITVIVP